MSNTADQYARIWSIKLAKIKTVLARLSRDVGNEAVKFFLEQFRKQVDPENKPWKPRKDGDTSRSLLVKSGRLRRSIKVTRLTQRSARIGASNISYAVFHQTGTNKIPQRKFLGKSSILERRLRRMIKAKLLWAIRG